MIAVLCYLCKCLTALVYDEKQALAAQRWASAARRRRDQEHWRHATTPKSRAEVDGCARSVGLHAVVGRAGVQNAEGVARRSYRRARASRA